MSVTLIMNKPAGWTDGIEPFTAARVSKDTHTTRVNLGDLEEGTWRYLAEGERF